VAVIIKHLREKLKLRENYGTDKQQNQRTLQTLKIMVGCRSYSVFNYVYISCLQIIKREKYTGETHFLGFTLGAL